MTGEKQDEATGYWAGPVAIAPGNVIKVATKCIKRPKDSKASAAKSQGEKIDGILKWLVASHETR